jgi:hypothetical protein
MEQLAPNVEAILNWVDTNRPDCSEMVRQLIRQDAIILLMAIAFSAGRTYQNEHPSLEPNLGYHR